MTDFFNRSGSPVTPIAGSINTKGAALYVALRSCWRCGGAGGSEAWRHTGWTCYACGGKGKWQVEEKCYTADKLAKLNATQAKRHEKVAAAAAVERAAQVDNFKEWAKLNEPAIWAVRTLAPDHEDGYVSSFVRGILHSLDHGVIVNEKPLDIAVGIAVSKAAEQDQRAKSRHVGKEGERAVFELNVDRVLRYDFGSYPTITTYIHLCRDAAGNRIVYKGSKRLCYDGESVKVKATVKEHGERDGELQTILARPAIIEEETA